MGPFRLTRQEARTLTVLLLILLAGLAGLVIFKSDQQSGDTMAAHSE
ncbi:MAG: hypothetical protein ACQKBV_05750 [Puniceicoccales bacterium]